MKVIFHAEEKVFDVFRREKHLMLKSKNEKKTRQSRREKTIRIIYYN